MIELQKILNEIKEYKPETIEQIIADLNVFLDSALGKGMIVNGRNRVTIEGYVTNLKFKDTPELKRLSFMLGSVSTSIKKPGQLFTMFTPTSFFNRGAEELAKRTHEGMYVEVEAKLRGEEKTIDLEALLKQGIKYFSYTEYKLIGTHLTGAEQIKKRIPMTPPKESENA